SKPVAAATTLGDRGDGTAIPPGVAKRAPTGSCPVAPQVSTRARHLLGGFAGLRRATGSAACRHARAHGRVRGPASRAPAPPPRQGKAANTLPVLPVADAKLFPSGLPSGKLGSCAPS